MARPIKEGIEYFPFDVGFFDDDKVALLTSEFGILGEAVVVRLLCKIYKHGYYYPWGEDECLLFCRWAGGIFHPEQVKEVLFGCLRRSIFDKQLFEVFGILTSRGIQKRFLQAVSERKKIDIVEQYWLIDFPSGARFNIIGPDNDINRPGNEVNLPNNTQSKEKKSKGKEELYPYQDILHYWNSICTNYPQIIKLTESRQDKIRVRLEEFGKDIEAQMATIKTIFEKTQLSTFMRGENKTGWKATFDWIFENSRNWVRVYEGYYDDRVPQQTHRKSGCVKHDNSKYYDSF